MYIEHVDPERRHTLRSALDGVRNIMHFHIQEDGIAVILQFAYEIRSSRIEQLHANLHVAWNASQLPDHLPRLRRIRVIQRNHQPAGHFLPLRVLSTAPFMRRGARSGILLSGHLHAPLLITLRVPAKGPGTAERSAMPANRPC
ncbi:hypothetical protein D3C71_1443620 [compost metagenome]